MKSIVVVLLLLLLVIWSESLHLPSLGFKSLLEQPPEGLHIALQNPPSYSKFNKPDSERF